MLTSPGPHATLIWQATQLKQDFKFRWFVNDDAQLQQTFEIEDKYFASTGLPVSIVTPPSADFDYSTIAAQKSLVALAAAVDANPFVEKDSVSMWYLGFREWACAYMGMCTYGHVHIWACAHMGMCM